MSSKNPVVSKNRRSIIQIGLYFKNSTVGFFKKLICIREIPELQVDNEKVPSYRVRFPAISVQREVVVAEFSMFYARRRFCDKISDAI